MGLGHQHRDQAQACAIMGDALGEARMGGRPRVPFHLSPLYPLPQQVLVTPPQKHTPGPSPPNPNLVTVTTTPGSPLSQTVSSLQLQPLQIRPRHSPTLLRNSSLPGCPTRPHATRWYPFPKAKPTNYPKHGDSKQHNLFPFHLTVLEGPGLTWVSVG